MDKIRYLTLYLITLYIDIDNIRLKKKENEKRRSEV